MRQQDAYNSTLEGEIILLPAVIGDQKDLKQQFDSTRPLSPWAGYLPFECIWLSGTSATLVSANRKRANRCVAGSLVWALAETEDDLCKHACPGLGVFWR